ncbi:MAG: ABC transporter permease [Gemmatimonadaceae bacterium]
MRETIARLIDWIRRDKLDGELKEELQFHRQQLERDIGISDAADTRKAARKLGNVTSIRENARERWSIPWMDHLWQDVRYALRGIRRNPGFTVVIVITLALGLGVNAAVFSLIDRLFLQAPGGVVNTQNLRRVYITQQSIIAGVPELSTNREFNYLEIEDLQRAIADVSSAMFRTDSVQLTIGATSRIATATFADANYWTTLGAELQLGRNFTSDEARIQVPGTVAIVSHGLWQREFNSSRDLQGTSVTVAGKRYDVIGVATPQFKGLDLSATDVWLPIGSMPIEQYAEGRSWFDIRGVPRLQFVVRSTQSANPATLDAKLTAGFRPGSIAYGYVDDSAAVVKTGSIIAALGPVKAGGELEISKRLVWISLLVLVIACANVANLLLTRLTERRREIGVRLALGVSRMRLANQFVVETLALTTISGIAALVVGSWAGGVPRARLLPETRWAGSVIEPRLLGGMLAVAGIIALVLALVPALHVRHFSAGDAMKSGQRSTTQSGNRLRASLVVGQTAVAVVLLTGAALCAESLRQILAVDIGYDIEQLVSAAPEARGNRGAPSAARDAEVDAALRDVAERIARERGVTAVALSESPPLGGSWSVGWRVPGIDSTPNLAGREPRLRVVDPSYWSVTDIHALQGRVFAASDANGAPLVIVLNAAMARTVWPGGNALGQCVIVYSKDLCRTVVGIVSDAHFGTLLEEPTMKMYVPLAQASSKGSVARAGAITVRADPISLPRITASLHAAINAAIPNADLKLQTMRDAIEPQYRPWKLGAFLFAVLATLGLLVASVGLYGVIAYGVRRRTHELSIRSALGAERNRIVFMVLRQGLNTVLTGLAIGMVASMALARYVASLVYGTSLSSPFVFGSVAAIMLLTAVLASFIPAWQAGRINPMTALRSE